MDEFKWTINEEQANLILETDTVAITKSSIFNDIDLTEEERMKRAAKILEKWRKIQTEEE